MCVLKCSLGPIVLFNTPERIAGLPGGEMIREIGPDLHRLLVNY